MNIHHLSLYTQQLSAQQTFYQQKLGLPLVSSSNSHFSVQIGQSTLTFKQAAPGVECYYHFAFNIPSSHYLDAPAWLQERAEVLMVDGEPIVNFENWNAHGIYFLDAEDNIVEFIARHDLNKTVEGPFTSKIFLNISEIGYPVNAPQPTADNMLSTYGLHRYKGNSEVFCPVGDPHGLFILVKKGRNWVPLDRPAVCSPFEVEFEAEGKKRVLNFE